MIIKVNKNNFIILIIGFFIVASIVITIILNPGQEAVSKKHFNIIENNLNSISVNSASDSIEQTSTMGAVQVDVALKKLGKNESKNIFAVSFNTHSVDLDFDFTEIITLRDDLGNIYKALEWTGNRGWHHVSGDIVFPSISNKASQVILMVSEIEELSRSFKWDII